MFYKDAKSELLLFFFFFFWGGGGGGREADGWSKGIFFFTKNPNKKMPILDIELAIDHPPPRGRFVHYDFLKLCIYKTK